uniref:Reverse transcriptase domain-containing protein n=1 Tax=Rhabditophanes sp. KR3021 TaxID=114890 RepID=A0AC35UHZ4_9BILA
MIKGMMCKWNIELIRKDYATPKNIPVKQRVYQGDSWSPLIFILVTAGIIHKVKTDVEVGKETRYRYKLIAFMDDLKAHSPTLEGLKLMTKVIEEGAAELGLELNKKKCGFYTRETEGNVVTAGANGNSETAGIEGDVGTAETDGLEGDEVGDEFLPRIKKRYKYLGITQLEKDIPEENFARMTTKYIERTKKILQSKLTTNQKRKLYNTTAIPAGIYVTGNLFPAERVASTLTRCRRIDLEVRKIAVNENIKTRPTANARMYLPEQIGGSAFRSLEVETCIQYIRRYVYLMAKTEVADAKKIFMAMHKGGCRSPEYTKEIAGPHLFSS